MEVKTDAKRRYLLYRLIVREHNFKINEIIGAVILGVLCRYLYILKKFIFQSLLKFLNWAQRVRSLHWLTSLLFVFSPLGTFLFDFNALIE